jgi:pimeloyl-ACP methyl ester carboxylesterase
MKQRSPGAGRAGAGMMRASAVAVAATFALATDAFAAGRSACEPKLASEMHREQRLVTFVASDGTQLAATLYEPSSRPAPAIVLVHMLGRSKDDWERVAERLEDAGAIVLAIDLRGHGRSSGSMATLPPMIDDVRSAIAWISARPGTRPGGIAVAGASLGANVAVLAAADLPAVHAIALISPSLDYRGLRIDAATMKKIGARPVWMAASTQDPYALRTLRELASDAGPHEQRLSNAVAHGTNLLSADPDLARGLVDWLRRTLIF